METIGARHGFQGQSEFGVCQRVNEKVNRMINDQEKIGREEKTDEEQRQEVSTGIAIDQTEDRQDEHRQLTDDVEEADDQHHSRDLRFRLQSLNDDFRRQNELFRSFGVDLSIDHADQQYPQNDTNHPRNQQGNDCRDHFENILRVRIGMIVVIRHNRKNTEDENHHQRLLLISTGTMNLRIERLDDDHQTKACDHQH